MQRTEVRVSAWETFASSARRRWVFSALPPWEQLNRAQVVTTTQVDEENGVRRTLILADSLRGILTEHIPAFHALELVVSVISPDASVRARGSRLGRRDFGECGRNVHTHRNFQLLEVFFCTHSWRGGYFLGAPQPCRW